MIQIIFLLAFLILAGIFMNTLSKTLKQISFENRKMQPDQVWLLFVPLFNYFWLFRTVNGIAESINAEFRRKGLKAPIGLHTVIGYIYAITFTLTALVSILNSFAVRIPPIAAGLLAIISLVCWIIYWITTASLKKQMKQLPLNEDSLIFGKIPVQH